MTNDPWKLSRLDPAEFADKIKAVEIARRLLGQWDTGWHEDLEHWVKTGDVRPL